MSLLSLPATPAAGFTENSDVRIATVDGVRMVSVFDVIKVAMGGCSNPREYWSRTTKTFPDLMAGVKGYRFEGQGQRDTPVIDAKRVVMLLNLLPGKTAAKFRIHFADIVVRYLGGDGTLVAEIQRNAEIQGTLEAEDPMSIFGDDVRHKRRRNEDNELQNTETWSLIIQRNINTIERAAFLMEKLNNGKIDGPSTLLLKDATQNALAPFSARLLSVPAGTANGATNSFCPERHQMPISDLYRELTGCSGSKQEWMRVGAAVAKEYRQRHGGRDPAAVERAIDGTTRMVKTRALLRWTLEESPCLKKSC